MDGNITWYWAQLTLINNFNQIIWGQKMRASTQMRIWEQNPWQKITAVDEMPRSLWLFDCLCSENIMSLKTRVWVWPCKTNLKHQISTQIDIQTWSPPWRKRFTYIQISSPMFITFLCLSVVVHLSLGYLKAIYMLKTYTPFGLGCSKKRSCFSLFCVWFVFLNASSHLSFGLFTMQ